MKQAVKYTLAVLKRRESKTRFKRYENGQHCLQYYLKLIHKSHRILKENEKLDVDRKLKVNRTKSKVTIDESKNEVHYFVECCQHMDDENQNNNIVDDDDGVFEAPNKALLKMIANRREMIANRIVLKKQRTSQHQ